jgi:hypothetical protein
MDAFRTIVNPEKADYPISHSDAILMTGSCFAENIGNKLIQLKFKVDLNPFGVLYNPVSIHRSLLRILNKELIKEDDLFLYDGIWHSFFHHSRFSSEDKEKCLHLMNSRIESSSNYLKNVRFLFITFGTAWVYNNIANGQPVSNCHKLPARNFERRILKVDEIVQDYCSLIQSIRVFNPDLKIIFTISPVRHLKERAEGNQISKSVLRLGVSELCNKGYGTYFPAYEIMLDDLRDYRFYDNDMVHPSQQAVDYIFEKFANAYFNDETKNLNKDIGEISDAFNHRPFNSFSAKFIEFAKANLEKIEKLEKENELLDFSEEKNYFSRFV